MATTERYVKLMCEMIGKGWDTTAHSASAIVDENYVQLITYWPHKVEMTFGVVSIDRVEALYQETNLSLPLNMRDPSILAGCVAHLGQQVIEKKTQKLEHDLNLALSVYMFSTQSYALFRTNALGQPFAFIAIMYPKNKKATEFLVRPAIAGANSIYTPADVEELAKSVMLIDRNNAKVKYFKHL